MDERQIRTRLSFALESELNNGSWETGFFCRWFVRRRLAWEKADGWGRLNSLYASDMDAARRRDYLSEARRLLKTEKRLPIDRKKWNRLLSDPKRDPAQRLLDGLHREILNAYALKDARTYYYDTFQPGRKKSRDLELLDAFCSEKGLALQSTASSQGVGGRMSPQELEDWETLVALLRENEQDDVFLPVCSDPRSGVGLYLVGADRIPWTQEQGQRRRGAHSCYFLFLMPSDIPFAEEDEPFRLELEEDRKEGEDVSLEDYDLPSVKEAESWFWGTAAAKVPDWLQDWNGTAPEGCPKRFLDRFYTPRRKPTLLTREEREELARQGRLAFQAGGEAAL